MSHFNSDAKSELQRALHSEEGFKLIILWGDKGGGKTYITHSVLGDNAITINDIVFSTESFFPLGTFSYEEWIDGDEYNILIKCSKKFYDGECVMFQNMEICELDYKELIYRMLRYHKNAKHPIIAIMEYNVREMPNDKLCSLAKYIIQVKEKDSTFADYLDIHFCYSDKNTMLFQKIIKMTNKNIETFFCVLNILQQLNIISKDDDDCYDYIDTSFDIPNNIITLYSKFLDKLEKHMKHPLFLSAPLSNYIYEKIVHTLFYKYDNFENYLDILCEDECLLSYNANYSCAKAELFKSSYVFSTEDARKAILSKLDDTAICTTISNYYNYFDKLYNNQEIYNNLQDTDKILLLCNLTQMHKNKFSLNQIKYIVDLMHYYYNHFMYLNAIEQGNKLIESKLLNPTQLNTESHQFWVIYFKALLVVGNYEDIIFYKEQFDDSDLNLQIARALYQNGNPSEALKVLETKVDDDKSNVGYKYSLMAAIYDWLGESKKSTKYFVLALKNCNDNLELKYQLYKNYSLYIDFRIPECQQNMEKAIQYYKTNNLKLYAECLHNFGTGCIFKFDFTEALEKLESCVGVLNKVCSNEIYYPLNSLAILSCYYNKDYSYAINLWKQALQYDVNIDFCQMAIHNNMFNIYIHMKKYNLAKHKKEQIEKMFLCRCSSLDNIKKEKPEIQLQLQQFYYNCGLLLKNQHRYMEALDAFTRAKECSSYQSVMIYSINCYIEEVRNKCHNKPLLFNRQKGINPTQIEKYIFDKQMYLCEIMFWE